MNDNEKTLTERARELRAEFDGSFSVARVEAVAAHEPFLAVRLAGNPFAIRLSEVGGVFVDRRITPLPGGRRGFLGLAGFRGVIWPVYDLGVLLGFGAEAAPRWIVTARGAAVAFAFQAFESHVQVERGRIASSSNGHVDASYSNEAIDDVGTSRSVIRLTSVIAAVKEHGTPTRTMEGAGA